MLRKSCDKALFPLVEKTLDMQNPRQWYYALMDYGSMLKKEFKNPARRSKHHTIQSRFEGSNRQIRGKVLEALLKYGALGSDDLCGFIKCDNDRLNKIAQQLVAEKMIISVYGKFFIA